MMGVATVPATPRGMSVPYLTVGDVAAMFGVKPKTVTQWLYESRTPKPGGKRRRYTSQPIPAPTYPHGRPTRGNCAPLWEPGPGETLDDVRERLREWHRGRPGPGAHNWRQAPS